MESHSLNYLVFGFFCSMLFVRFIVCSYRLFMLIARVFHCGNIPRCTIHSTDAGHMGSIWFGAVRHNSADRNIPVHVFR